MGLGFKTQLPCVQKILGNRRFRVDEAAEVYFSFCGCSLTMLSLLGNPGGSELGGLHLNIERWAPGRREVRQSWRGTASQAPWNRRPKPFPCALCVPSTQPLSQSDYRGVFAGHWPFLEMCHVSGENVEGECGCMCKSVCVCVCMCYQTQIKLFYCILSDRSSVHSSAVLI